MQKPLQITVGVSGGPVAGSSEWVSPSLAGQAGYLIKVGYGPLPYEDYIILPGGGVQLLNGRSFSANEIFFWQPTGISYGVGDSSYTNGFDYARVMSAMFGRIGWQQQSPTPVLNSNNRLSKSGRFFQAFHALVTVDNVKALVEKPHCSDSELNDLLESMQKAAIMRCLTNVFREKEYFEQTLLYDRFDEGEIPEANEGKFVGYEITVPRNGNISVQVDSVRMLFDQDVTLPLYLFVSGKKSPIWQAEVSAVAHEATVVNIDNVVLNYLTDITHGSKFYLGYFQADLGAAMAIREDASWNKTLCFGAIGISAVAIAPADFDRQNISHTYEPAGINLSMSSFRDHTATIVKKSNLFDEAVGLQMAYNVIEQVIYSSRSNARERILKDQIDKVGLQLELNGYAPVSQMARVTGIAQRIDKEFDRVRKELFSHPKSQTVSLC